MIIIKSHPTSFLFWNIHKKADNLHRAVCYARENNIDIISLCEMPDEFESSVQGYRLVTHFDPKCSDIGVYTLLTGGLHYFTEKPHYALLRLDELGINLVVMHLNALLYAKSTDYQYFDLNQALSDIERIESRYGDKRTVILGDFNFNLFDEKMLSPVFLNACLFKYQTVAEHRMIREVKKDFYYNPMLQVYKDCSADDVPKGTYYYKDADPVWHCYDHVLIKYPLVNSFVDESLHIVSQLGGEQLVENNKPSGNYSDHLPVIFQILIGGSENE